MTRCLSVAISLLALGACHTKQESEPGTGSTVRGSGSGAAERGWERGSDLPLDGRTLVRAAFGGTVPAFPQLSRDGATAIVELETPVGLSGISTYSVAYLVTANHEPAIVPLVDSRLVHVLLEAGEGATIDTDTLATTAGAITKRLADEGFTTWHGSAELTDKARVTAGPFALKTTRTPAGGITIEAVGSGDAVIAIETIEPVAMGQVSGIECVSKPIARKAWFDRAHKRLLLQVAWNAGADACDVPDDQYRFWARP